MSNLDQQNLYGQEFLEIRKWNEDWHTKAQSKVSGAWKFLLGWWGFLLVTKGQYTMIAFGTGVVASTLLIGKWLVEDHLHWKKYQRRIRQIGVLTS